MENKFNYVIARKWFDDSNQLCCYVFHNTVFYGDLEDAKSTRNFIRERAEDHNDEYEIYKIDDNFLKID
jgi:hypothetical protein